MGTNFYWIKQNSNYSEDHPINHIGKRSAAGAYCWDCGITLCHYGTTEIHRGNSDWHEVCPFCGKSKQEQSLNESTAGKELGFNNSQLKYTGIGSACSFTWTIMNCQKKIMLKSGTYIGTVEKIIKDEYGVEYTAREFIEMLNDCPIQFQHCAEFC